MVPATKKQGMAKEQLKICHVCSLPIKPEHAQQGCARPHHSICFDIVLADLTARFTAHFRSLPGEYVEVREGVFMEWCDVVYTVGNTEAYERYFASQKPKELQKAVGGSVWQARNEAQRHAPQGFTVYGVAAKWGRDTERDPEGNGWHRLTRDAQLFRLP